MNASSDILLWKQIQLGNTEAFKSLYEKYIDDLLLFGQKLTSDNELIQDTVQQLFLRLWDSRLRLSAPKHTKAYLMKSLRNNLSRALKQEKFISDIDIEDHLQGIPGVSKAEDDSAEIDRLQLALEQLPARQKEVLHLRFYQDIKNQEIAEIMGISYQSVCNLLQRAIKQMKVLIPKDL